MEPRRVACHGERVARERPDVEHNLHNIRTGTCSRASPSQPLEIHLSFGVFEACFQGLRIIVRFRSTGSGSPTCEEENDYCSMLETDPF